MGFIRTAAFVAPFAFIPLLGHAESVDELTKADQAAQELSVGGISPGTPLEKFLKEFPAAKKLSVRADVFPKNDLYGLTVDNGTSHPPNVTLEFEGGVLALIRIDFSRDSLKAVTRKGPMLQQLGSHFGNPRLVSKGVEADLGTVDVYCWDFSRVGRQITFYDFHNDTAQLLVFNEPVTPDTPPKTSLLGFD